jgi:hypothetical protein
MDQGLVQAMVHGLVREKVPVMDRGLGQAMDQETVQMSVLQSEAG